MSKAFRALLDRFIALGGVAENICQREGDSGRGIFPIDSSLRAKIMTPKNLFVKSRDICLDGKKVVIKGANSYTPEEIDFLEMYWNDYSWGNGGNNDSASFLKFIVSLEDPIKKQLLSCRFIDSSLLSYREDDTSLLKRFVSERVVIFEGQSILAPVWEFVNHSSFAPTFRANPYGVETPPIQPSSNEILFKYSVKNSPIGMWKKYGFSCDCIAAYSIPLNIEIAGQFLSVRCDGGLGLGSNEKQSFSIVGNVLHVKSLPVGCLSIGLPWEYFKSIFSSVGLSVEVAGQFFSKIREANLKSRYDLINLLVDPGYGAESQLYRALMYEVNLIEDSLIV